MSDVPHDSEGFFDPSSFDADAFLAESQDVSDLFDAEIAALETDSMAVESTVMDALERVGFPVTPIRNIQSQLAPAQSLSYCVAKMLPMRDRLRIAQQSEEATALDALIVISFAIEEVVSQKWLSDMSASEIQPLHKKEQQVAIYANNTLHPNDKAFFLAAIEELYPDVEGLESDSPGTVITIEAYAASEKVNKEILNKSRALRELAEVELRSAMAEQGLGQHDQLDSIISSISTILTRMYVLETGSYDSKLRAAAEMAARIGLGQSLDAARAMGWTELQFETILQHVRASLRAHES